MKKTREELGTAQLVLAPITAAIATFILLMASALIIDSLPRASVGESVIVPWTICIIGAFFIQIGIPSIIAILFIKNRNLILYGIVSVILTSCMWLYLLEGLDFLSKAYRRGL